MSHVTQHQHQISKQIVDVCSHSNTPQSPYQKYLIHMEGLEYALETPLQIPPPLYSCPPPKVPQTTLVSPGVRWVISRNYSQEDLFLMAKGEWMVEQMLKL